MSGISKTGVVKFFDNVKGWGYIIDDETNEDVYVHRTGLIAGVIEKDETVIFSIEEGSRGPKAVNVSNY